MSNTTWTSTRSSTSTPGAPTSARPVYLTADQLQQALAITDLTRPQPGGPSHAIALIADAIIDALTTTWQIRSRPIRVSPLVCVADNYDRLGYRGDDVTRDSRYTRYVSPTTMLRSHTSANIPYALSRYVGGEQEQAQPQTGSEIPGTTLRDLGRPVDELINVAGLVYRRDVVDRHHVGEPHQLDLWRLRSEPETTEDQLEQMIGLVVEAVLPGAQWRTTPTVHPYTERGRQVDVLAGGHWLELAECGLIAPHVLRSSGLDPDGWSGLALGLGLDRAVMLRKQIPDIRYLRSTEPRIAAQLEDLSLWRPVSMLPPITRDLSVVIDADTVEETIGDAIRSELGDRVEDVESIEIRSRTPYADLPPTAQARLGLNTEQDNALIRITLRPLEHTLTDEQANAIRNRVYRAIHRGPYLELA